jgi:hypothetical protein
LTVHSGAAMLFPAMALVVWLLIRGLPGRAAKVASVALPVFVGSLACWTAISAAIVALKRAGAGAASLIPLGGLMVFHALAAYQIDRRPLPDLQPA